MTPIVADGIALLGFVALFALAGGLLLGLHAWRGGKLWKEPHGED